MLKKLWHSAASALLMVLTVGCSGGGSDDSTTGSGDVSKTYLQPLTSGITIPATGGSSTISLQSNTSWEVKTAETLDWITLDRSDGTGDGYVQVTATANTGYKRATTLVFTGGGITRKCTVTQEGLTDNLTTSTSKIEFAAAGGTDYLTITCESAWTITNPISDWCTLDRISGEKGTTTVSITVAANTTTESRTGTLTVSGQVGESEAVYISQEKGETTTPSDQQTTDGLAVDLGLPSGTKWASHNIGATNPEDYGDYYAWGETVYKSDYSWSTYMVTSYSACGTSSDPIYQAGLTDIAGSKFDVATAKWGASWKMPTDTQIDELLNKCTWTWTTQNNVKGYKVTGLNGNSIFLPAAGRRYGSSLHNAGSFGFYWSATRYASYAYDAYYLYFYSSDQGRSNDYRYYGFTVRPVSE